MAVTTHRGVSGMQWFCTDGALPEAAALADLRLLPAH